MRVSCQQAIGTTDGQSPKTRRTQLAQERRSSSNATHKSSQYGYNSVQEIGSGTVSLTHLIMYEKHGPTWGVHQSRHGSKRDMLFSRYAFFMLPPAISRKDEPSRLPMRWWALITGGLEIAAVVKLCKEIEGEWLLALSGLLSMVLGFLLVFFPEAGVIGLVWYLGVYAVVFGILMVALSWRLRTRQACDHSQPAQVAA